MNILALETSTEYCSVALWQDGIVLEHSERVGQKHSELLVPMLDAVLREAGCAIQDVDGIAYGSGPGSFTGVRIACGVTQGLAFGASLPVAGISTLLALAEASGRQRVIAALDARMSEIYCAAYEKCGDAWITVCEPCLCRPEDAPVVPGANWFGAGSGFAEFGEVLQARYGAQLNGVNAAAVPQAAAIASLGAAQLAGGQGVDAAAALPLYLRDKVALKTIEREQLAAEKSLSNL